MIRDFQDVSVTSLAFRVQCTGLRWQEVQRDRKAVKQHEGGMISNKRMADLVTKKLAPSYGAASDATI